MDNTIVVKNLSKDYGDHKAVKEISFNIKKGVTIQPDKNAIYNNLDKKLKCNFSMDIYFDCYY